MQPNIEAVIFDMDGVIIDSEPMQVKAYNKILKTYGVEVTEEEFIANYVGRKGTDILARLREIYQIPVNIDELLAAKNAAYLTILRKNIRPMPGLLELLDYLVPSRFRLGVASSSSLSDIEEVLKGIGIHERFTAIASGEEVLHGKPAPDIFLEAARRLSANPQACAVLEDTQIGVQAAVNAGMYCVAVPNRFTVGQDFSQAQARVENLQEVTSIL